MDGRWINHYISLGLSYTRFPWNGFYSQKQWTGEVSLILLYYFTLFYVMWLRIWVLILIPVPNDGPAEPKHIVHWHNCRINDVVCKKYIYIYCGVSEVFIITAFEDLI
jgi:hypothetical protein